VAEEPLKTIAGAKLSDEKEVVGNSEAPKIIKLKDNLVCIAIASTPSSSAQPTKLAKTSRLLQARRKRRELFD